MRLIVNNGLGDGAPSVVQLTVSAPMARRQLRVKRATIRRDHVARDSRGRSLVDEYPLR